MGGLSVLGIAASHSAHLRGIVSFNGSGDWELSHLFMQARFGISFGRNWTLYEELEKRNPSTLLKIVFQKISYPSDV